MGDDKDMHMDLVVQIRTPRSGSGEERKVNGFKIGVEALLRSIIIVMLRRT